MAWEAQPFPTHKKEDAGCGEHGIFVLTTTTEDEGCKSSGYVATHIKGTSESKILQTISKITYQNGKDGAGDSSPTLAPGGPHLAAAGDVGCLPGTGTRLHIPSLSSSTSPSSPPPPTSHLHPASCGSLPGAGITAAAADQDGRFGRGRHLPLPPSPPLPTSEGTSDAGAGYVPSVPPRVTSPPPPPPRGSTTAAPLAYSPPDLAARQWVVPDLVPPDNRGQDPRPLPPLPPAASTGVGVHAALSAPSPAPTSNAPPPPHPLPAHTPPVPSGPEVAATTAAVVEHAAFSANAATSSTGARGCRDTTGLH
ncbi:predicted GPI-anchored protein 58 [Miscanthus floridulus]|uniref:predicted GPI-anchored protein 58 n=1 Tax=Miscanthus floridulus TaxID=154761 RepID=UPI003459DD12